MLFLTPTMACKKQVKKYNKGNLLSNLSYLTSSEGISDVNELPDSTSIMIVGGYDGNGFFSEATNSVDLIGDVTCSLPQLPINIPYQPSIILTNDDEILACRGYPNNMQECLVLKDQNWIKHSDLIEKRYDSSAVTMAKGAH